MDNIISYDAVRTLLGNPPSLNTHPNFFNICALQNCFTKALKKIPCPQSTVNGWAGTVMSPELYIFINPNPFHLNTVPVATTPAYPNKFNPDGVSVPYRREEKLMQDLPWSRTTSKHGKTYTKMLSKLHRQQHRQQQVRT